MGTSMAPPSNTQRVETIEQKLVAIKETLGVEHPPWQPRASEEISLLANTFAKQQGKFREEILSTLAYIPRNEEEEEVREPHGFESRFTTEDSGEIGERNWRYIKLDMLLFDGTSPTGESFKQRGILIFNG